MMIVVIVVMLVILRKSKGVVGKEEEYYANTFDFETSGIGDGRSSSIWCRCVGLGGIEAKGGSGAGDGDGDGGGKVEVGLDARQLLCTAVHDVLLEILKVTGFCK